MADSPLNKVQWTPAAKEKLAELPLKIRRAILEKTRGLTTCGDPRKAPRPGKETRCAQDVPPPEEHARRGEVGVPVAVEDPDPEEPEDRREPNRKKRPTQHRKEGRT